MNKAFALILIWAVVSLAYVIVAIAMPTIQTVSTNIATTINTTSNMTNYPGTLETVQIFPLLAWFIPGAVGIGATVYMLRKED